MNIRIIAFPLGTQQPVVSELSTKRLKVGIGGPSEGLLLPLCRPTTLLSNGRTVLVHSSLFTRIYLTLPSTRQQFSNRRSPRTELRRSVRASRKDNWYPRATQSRCIIKKREKKGREKKEKTGTRCARFVDALQTRLVSRRPTSRLTDERDRRERSCVPAYILSPVRMQVSRRVAADPALIVIGWCS